MFSKLLLLKIEKSLYVISFEVNLIFLTFFNDFSWILQTSQKSQQKMKENTTERKLYVKLLVEKLRKTFHDNMRETNKSI